MHICDIIVIVEGCTVISARPIKAERKCTVPIEYKIDILSELKAAGYSTYRLRKEKLLGEATMQKIRRSELVSWENIATICRLLQCQPGDIIEYVEDNEAR